MRAVVLMFVLASLVPVAAGQSAPSVESSTFYGRVDCDTATYGLSTVQESTSTNCGTGDPSTSMSWTLPETRAADSTLTFADGGEVTMTIWIGSNTHAGNVEVTGTVLSLIHI